MKIISGKITDIQSSCTILLLDKTAEPLPDLPEAVKEAYEERAAVMEYEGELSRDKAESQAWCRTACMLSFPSQWKLCERFKPKACINLEKKN